ncbi:protein Wiz isoform X2 [Misgurnus anguillicaudatus]|uniref:protein Wiz isoform X2 n=2 Tax=Misgurnus anguillicaudatus TaxID=75329 RepID=UPI003CCF00AD
MEVLAMEMITPETAKKSSGTFSNECLKTNPEKPFEESGCVHVCEVCGTSFETRKGLSSHARSHLRQLGVYSSGAPIDLLYQLMKERGGTLPKPKNQASTVKKSKAQFPKLKKHNRPKIKIKISNLVKKKYALSSSSTTAVKKSAKSGRFPFAPMKPGKASSKGTAGSKVSKSKSGNEAVKSRLDDGGPSTSLPLASPKPLWAPQETDAPLNLTTMINSTAARDDVHVCELCGAWYETRKGLSSHARAHLRQFGVALDPKCGPIELLHNIIQTEEFQEKLSAEQQEETSVLENCTSTPSISLSIPKNPSLSPKKHLPCVTPPPPKKLKMFPDAAGSLTDSGKTDLKAPSQGETSKSISCEFCHEKFKKNQSLASHARGHLRQLGITEWTVNGSPMATLRTVMAQRGASSGSLKAPEPLAPSTPTSPSGPPTVPHLPSSPKVITQSSSLPVRLKVPKARKGSRTVFPKPKNEPLEVDISIVGSPKPQSEPMSPLSPQKMSAPTTVKSPVTPPKLEKQDLAQFVFCDYCGAMFETRKALSCHARAHLRQMGVKYSEKVSAIDALRELMQREGNDRASDVKPESYTGSAVQWKKTASSPRTVTPSPVDFTKDKAAPDVTTPGFSDATCELCGFDFENRKALASHARAHLRHVGVDWKVIGSPIETLAAWMKNEPKKVADLHKRYSKGDLPLVKKGPRKPPSANHSSDSESVRMGSPKASSGARVSAGQPPVSPPSKAALVPEAGREIKAGMSHSSFSQRKRPSSGEPPLSSLIQSPAAHSGLNVRSPRGFERRPSKHFSHTEKISEETEPSKPSRAGNIPSLVPRPPETRLVKLVGKVYSLKCRFCEEVFHGPLSIQEDWVMHLQQHILKLKKDSTSSPQSSRRRDTVEPSLNRTEATLLIGPQAV